MYRNGNVLVEILQDLRECARLAFQASVCSFGLFLAFISTQMLLSRTHLNLD